MELADHWWSTDQSSGTSGIGQPLRGHDSDVKDQTLNLIYVGNVLFILPAASELFCCCG